MVLLDTGTPVTSREIYSEDNGGVASSGPIIGIENFRLSINKEDK